MVLLGIARIHMPGGGAIIIRGATAGATALTGGITITPIIVDRAQAALVPLAPEPPLASALSAAVAAVAPAILPNTEPDTRPVPPG